ncbi:MAG TPA: hypothetical protein DD490_03980 [Acidobacteria bacterium]|nr:hypothetical protein [Acidobacteriota bacterium]
MLILDGKPFTTGRARFFDQHPRFPEPSAKIYVQVEFAGLDGTWIAQVDTGAAYSILEIDVATALGLLGLKKPWTRLSTRLGVLNGQLIRLPVALVADDGESLEVEAPFFVSPDWRGGTFLGYTGLLDRLRFALDSPANLFYFGEGG